MRRRHKGSRHRPIVPSSHPVLSALVISLFRFYARPAYPSITVAAAPPTSPPLAPPPPPPHWRCARSRNSSPSRRSTALLAKEMRKSFHRRLLRLRLSSLSPLTFFLSPVCRHITAYNRVCGVGSGQRVLPCPLFTSKSERKKRKRNLIANLAQPLSPLLSVPPTHSMTNGPANT